MSGWGEALLTYGLTIIISFCVAGMIHLMVVLLEKHSKKKSKLSRVHLRALPDFSSDITALKFGVNSV